MKRAGSGSNVAARAVLLAIAYVLVTAGLLAGLLYQLRNEALVAAKKELGAYAQLTAGHTFEVALGVEEALQLAAMTLSVASGSGAADETQIRQMLRDVAANARVLKDIVVIDATGRTVYQANGRDDIGKDRSSQPYFARFKADPELKFEIAAAARGMVGPADAWSIPMARVWRSSDGAFAGVVVGLLDPQYFGKAWTFDSELKGLAIALTAADGTVITRQPFSAAIIGRPLFDAPASGPPVLAGQAATLVAPSPLDDGERLFAYRKVAAYPTLLVFVSQPMDVVLAGWRRVATIVGGGWLVASLALGVLGFWLARTIKARGLLEGRYRALFDSIPHPVIVSDDSASRVLAFNAAAARQYAWTGEPAADGTSLPADFELLMTRRSQFSSDTAIAIEGQRHRNGAGELIDVDMTVRLIDYNGRPAILTIAVDVTARKQAERERQAAEEKLRQSQKMDVLGQLTGGIAHDFNNTLMVVQGNVETLLERRDLDPEIESLLVQIARSTESAEELTRHLLAFSRKQPLRPRPTSVNDLIVETGKLLRRTLGEQIEIDAVLSDDLWPVDIDRAQLRTSLVNLSLNARDAMPGGGRLLIETQNVRLDLPRAGSALTGDCVLINVNDSGDGIASENVEKIFEPFFTTKSGSRNSGLGLSMVYGFVKQSRGHIEVESELGRGTSLRIYLPRGTDVAATTTRREAAPLTGGNERVLVVEDDEQVRGSIVRKLVSLGYRVDQAADGVSGLAAFEAAQTPYDLLLSDVIMPGGLNGKELGDEVCRRWPETRIVFMSGYVDNAFGDRQVLLLSKPFSKADLAQMMRLALGGEIASTAA